MGSCVIIFLARSVFFIGRAKPETAITSALQDLDHVSNNQRCWPHGDHSVVKFFFWKIEQLASEYCSHMSSM